jgi:hypothetical protein
MEIKDEFKILRNRVWRTLWKSQIEYENKIRALVDMDGAVIINCCTSDLKPYINKCLKNKVHFEARHPSVWNSKTIISIAV